MAIKALTLDTGGTILDWHGGISRAFAAAGRCRASFEDGQLLIEWRILEPRQIAMLRVPQLNVCFTYSGFEDARRQVVQTYFDRATQRGGG